MNYAYKMLTMSKPRERLRDVGTFWPISVKCSEYHANLYEARNGPYFLL